MCRGGKRENSGRKLENRKVITIRIKNDLIEKIKNIENEEKKTFISKLEFIIESYFKNNKHFEK